MGSAVDRLLLRVFAALTRDVPMHLALGQEVATAATEASLARLVFRDRRALLRMLFDPEMQFGELYVAGRVAVEGDLEALMEGVLAAFRPRGRLRRLTALRNRLRPRPRRNSLARARRNVHHHYDLGNDFYALWLDRTAMQYTCAYYPEAELSLEEAQLAKMHHTARKLRLEPGQEVIEAGSGWGGFACFLARHYGVRVRAYNTSGEQVAYSRALAERLGLGGAVQFHEEDYRSIDGECDAFVSVGMLEHVGTNQYRVLGEVIDRTLRPGGLGLIHTIGRNRPGRLNPWIERRIFPGAHPPSLREMMAIFEPFELSILDVENLRLHYARTLEQWLERFEARREEVVSLFDERFVRTWRFYLSGSIASFRAGSLQLFQVVFARARNNDLAASRAQLYSHLATGAGAALAG